MANRIKLGFLLDTFHSDSAGTEKQLLNFIKRSKNLFDIDILSLYESAWLRDNNLPCKVISLRYRGFLKLNFFYEVFHLVKIIRANGYNLVHVFFEDALIVGCLIKLLSSSKIKFVVHRRDLGLGKNVPVYHSLFVWLRPLLLRYYDGVIVNATAIKEHLITELGVCANKIHLIPNGIELPSFSITNFNSLHKTRNDMVKIGLVANLKPVKRVDLFIQAIAQLVKLIPEIPFSVVILGDGPLRGKLELMTQSLGIDDLVEFVGRVNDVSIYLKTIDIGVLCSDREGLSNAIIEYMAHGLPVVCTDAGGNGELVDEENGICVEPGNLEQLVIALKDICCSSKLRIRMGAKSRDRVEKYYMWENIIPQWEDCCIALLGQE